MGGPAPQDFTECGKRLQDGKSIPLHLGSGERRRLSMAREVPTRAYRQRHIGKGQTGLVIALRGSRLPYLYPSRSPPTGRRNYVQSKHGKNAGPAPSCQCCTSLVCLLCTNHHNPQMICPNQTTTPFHSRLNPLPAVSNLLQDLHRGGRRLLP